MSTTTIAVLKLSLTRVIAESLTPQSEHRGFSQFKSRYIQNGHIGRLIDSYARILSEIPPQATVVVLGASPLEGFLLEQTKRIRAYQLYGSPEHLSYRSADDFEFTRDLCGPSDGQVYAVKRHNLETPLPDANESFDAVICLEVLEHLRRDPLAFMGEVRRVLKPSGSLFLSTPNLNSARAISRALDWESPMFFPSFGPPPSGIIHAHEYSLFEVLALVTRAGLRVERIDSFDHPQTDSFNHDLQYRSRKLLDQDTLTRLKISGVETSEIIAEIRSSPLRGDYLFLQASRTGESNQQPYATLFHLFDDT